MPLPVDSATVHGTYGTDTQAVRQVRQVRENITRVYPESTPFFALLQRTSTVSDGRANKLEWQYMADYPRTVVVATAASASATTIVVSAATHITESVLLLDPVTREQILVTARTGTSLTVATRGTIGGGTPGALAVGKALLVLSTAREEGAERLAAMGITPVQDYNWQQQHEHVTAISDRAEAIMMYGPNQRDLDAMEAMSEYKKRREKQFLFGYRKRISAGSSGATNKDRFIAGGLMDYIVGANNLFDAGGAFTYQELCQFMKILVRVGRGKTFFGFASLDVSQIMSQWGLQYHQADHMRSPEYGIELTRFHGAGGWTLNLVHSETMEEIDQIHNTLMIVNPKHVREVYMRGMGDRVNRNVTGPTNDGSHTMTDQITGTSTLEVTLPDAHAAITNITS